MSANDETVLTEEQSIAYTLNKIYGSDLRVQPIEGRTYLGLATKNGDFDVVGVVPGNPYSDIIRITIQRFLTRLYTPLSEDGLQGSNFIKYTKTLNDVNYDTRIRILKAEIMFCGSRIPQISQITKIEHEANADKSAVKLIVFFTLVTGETTQFSVTESL